MHVMLLTIGQSPRPDLTEPFMQVLQDNAKISHAGLLDGLDRNQVEERFSPSIGGTPLVTRLADGQEVLISALAAQRAVQDLLDRYQQQGPDMVLLLCTGVFEGLEGGKVRLIQPDQLVPAAVRTRVGGGRVGVIVPTDAQLQTDRHKWDALDARPVLAAASPYAQDWQACIGAAAMTLRNAGMEWIVLDCMGYGQAHAEAATQASGLPVLVSRQLLLEALAVLL